MARDGESFFHLGSATLRDQACQGTACFLARHRDPATWARAVGSSPRVRTGDPVRVRSRYGEATLPAEVSTRVAEGTVFATFHDPTTAVNRVTGDDRDPVTHTPGYKRTAVQLERAT